MKTALYLPNLEMPSLYFDEDFDLSDTPLIPVTFNLGNSHCVFYLKDIPSMLKMQKWGNPLLQSHNELSTIVTGSYFLCSGFWMQDYIFENMKDCTRIWRISDFSYIDLYSKNMDIIGGKDFGNVQVFIVYNGESDHGDHALLMLYNNKRILIPTGCINDIWEFDELNKTNHGFIVRFRNYDDNKTKNIHISNKGRILRVFTNKIISTDEIVNDNPNPFSLSDSNGQWSFKITGIYKNIRFHQIWLNGYDYGFIITNFVNRHLLEQIDLDWIAQRPQEFHFFNCE